MSKETGEWMYVFRPSVGGVIVYVKVVLRADCVVISFHEEEDQSDEDDERLGAANEAGRDVG